MPNASAITGLRIQATTSPAVLRAQDLARLGGLETVEVAHYKGGGLTTDFLVGTSIKHLWFDGDGITTLPPSIEVLVDRSGTLQSIRTLPELRFLKVRRVPVELAGEIASAKKLEYISVRIDDDQLTIDNLKPVFLSRARVIRLTRLASALPWQTLAETHGFTCAFREQQLTCRR